MRVCIGYKGYPGGRNMDEGKFRRTYLRDLTACWGPTGRLLWLDLCVWGVLLGVHSIDSLRTSLFLPFLFFFFYGSACLVWRLGCTWRRIYENTRKGEGKQNQWKFLPVGVL